MTNASGLGWVKEKTELFLSSCSQIRRKKLPCVAVAQSANPSI